MALAPSGNVFCNPGEPGKRLNEQNVRDMKARQVTRFGSTDGTPAVDAAPRNSLGMVETDEEGRATPSVAVQEQANVAETLASLRSLRRQAQSGNRAAQGMLTTLAATERSMPGGGRQSVLRELQASGL